MRHTQHHLFQAKLPAAFNNLLKPGDKRLATIQTKAFSASKLTVQKDLELLGLY